MIEAPRPDNEEERLEALRAYEVLDTDPEEAFDDLTRVAARICGTPVALVSLVDAHRQWFKSRVGLAADETPRDVAFCSHAILSPDDLLVVGDARTDPRFHDNPLVTGAPNVIFYAGAPLVTPEGHPLGTLCVIDHAPRDLDPETLDTLRSLARATVTQLELRRSCAELARLTGRLSSTNRDLNRRNAEIRRFYQTLSHELKTPLTIVKDYVSMVLEGLAGEVAPQQREFLETGLENCDRMATQVNDLLDVTRLETGKMRLEAAPLSLPPLVDSAVTSLRPHAERNGVKLSYWCGDDVPEIEADADRLVQVVSNIVRNAIKFTPEGGRVRVETRPSHDRDGHVEISVRDTGRGIPPDELARIFERLYQCRDDDAGSMQGLGIGLHLCREITRLHGGEVAVESIEGAGATFRVVLPTRIPPGEDTEKKPKEETVP